MLGELVEIGVADVHGLGNTALFVPGRLKRQAAQNEVNEFTNLAHPPSCPGPDLGRNVVKHRNAVRPGTSGDPPVETRIIDQDHRVGLIVAKEAIRPENQADERDDVQQHVQEPHHREIDQRIEQRSAGLRHPGTAITDEPSIGHAGPKRMNQIGGMQIAARLSGRDEDPHGQVSLPCINEPHRPGMKTRTDEN